MLEKRGNGFFVMSSFEQALEKQGNHFKEVVVEGVLPIISVAGSIDEAL